MAGEKEGEGGGYGADLDERGEVVGVVVGSRGRGMCRGRVGEEKGGSATFSSSTLTCSGRAGRAGAAGRWGRQGEAKEAGEARVVGHAGRDRRRKGER